MSSQQPTLRPPIRDWPLPYVAHLGVREPSAIDLVVMHCTELPDLETARTWGERPVHPSGTGNSGHFYLDRDGSIHQYVDIARVAHHVRGQNERSIGVELVNTGRWPDWFDTRRQTMREPYPDTQIESLLRLIAWLRAELPGLRFIAGHEDLDHSRVPASDRADQTVARKRDPGPMFPWVRVLQHAGLERLVTRADS